jgi:glycosyltransferase involved in cell wall biosynthesis
MSKSAKLVIIQDVPTQFDMPLYNLIAEQKPFELEVFYTKDIQRDPETGCIPHWDHVTAHHYNHHFLSRLQCRLSVLTTLVMQAKPDHVIICGYWPKLYRDVARKLKSKGISVGLRSDNTIEHTDLSGLRGWLKRKYLSRLLPIYDYWHPVGHQAADYLRFVADKDNKVALFPYNVDNDWFKTQSQLARSKRSHILQEFGLRQDSYVVLGIMKWSEREDPLTLVRAFKKIKQTYPNVALILAGEGPLRDSVMRELDGVLDTHLPGFVPYSVLPKLYGVADVFVHPAPGEPWGVSVNEALSSGVPVIASDRVGAAIELLQDGETGVFFQAGNRQELANSLNRWMQISIDFAQNDSRQTCREALHKWNYATTIESFIKVLL